MNQVWCSQSEFCTDNPQNCNQYKVSWIADKVNWECPTYFNHVHQCPNISCKLFKDSIDYYSFNSNR